MTSTEQFTLTTKKLLHITVNRLIQVQYWLNSVYELINIFYTQ